MKLVQSNVATLINFFLQWECVFDCCQDVQQYFATVTNLNHLMLRARYNPQRHYEIYQVQATDGITADDIRDMFEASPQTAADTIRRLGHCYFSDRVQEDRVVIR